MIAFVPLFNRQRQPPKQAPRDNSRNPNRARRGPVYDEKDEAAAETKRQMARRFKEAFQKEAKEQDQLKEKPQRQKLNPKSRIKRLVNLHLSQHLRKGHKRRRHQHQCGERSQIQKKSRKLLKKPKKLNLQAVHRRRRKHIKFKSMIHFQPHQNVPRNFFVTLQPAAQYTKAYFKVLPTFNGSDVQTTSSNVTIMTHAAKREHSFSATDAASVIVLIAAHRARHVITIFATTHPKLRTVLPDDVGSANAGNDLQAVTELVQEGKSQFGKSRVEQAEHRRQAFEALRRKAQEGSFEIKSSYLRKQLVRGPDTAAEIADYTRIISTLACEFRLRKSIFCTEPDSRGTAANLSTAYHASLQSR